MIAKEQLKLWLAQVKITVSVFEQQPLDNAFNNLWADNGDWLSKIYAGTGALKSSYTRHGKSSVFGFLDDVSKSMNRLYVSNFQDGKRQEAIQLLLNNGPSLKTPGMDQMRQEVQKRMDEYSTREKISVICATYNLNGKLNPDQSLHDLLSLNGRGVADIIVIGVQELIQLTPGEYITADTDKLRAFWTEKFLEIIKLDSQADHVLLRSLNLVALGLFVYIRPHLISRLREFDSASVKVIVI